MASRLKNQVPNAITALNLFSGCVALALISQGKLHYAAYAVFAGAIFDFFDGMVARALKAYSDIGKQLDSLADAVTFGVVPGYLIYTFLKQSTFCANGTCWKAEYLPYYGFLLTVFSAYRLAKFNVDTRQSDSFIGVPTPITALAIMSFVFLPEGSEIRATILDNHYVLVGITLILSLLLVSEIPMLALKFKTWKLKGNEIRFVLMLLSLLLILVLGFCSISLILLLYILLSLLNNKINIPKK